MLWISMFWLYWDLQNGAQNSHPGKILTTREYSASWKCRHNVCRACDEPSFHNISGYCFCALESPDKVRDELKTTLETLAVLGTVLIAREGINVALVGSATAITAAQRHFMEDERFSKIDFKLSLSTFSPFSKLKVKTRPEIITFGKTGIDPVNKQYRWASIIFAIFPTPLIRQSPMAALILPSQ